MEAVKFHIYLLFHIKIILPLTPQIFPHLPPFITLPPSSSLARIDLLALMPSHIQQPLQINTFRSLNRQTKRPIPDQLCEWAETTAHAEGDGVVKWLLEAVVVEEDAGCGIDVGVRIFGLDFC